MKKFIIAICGILIAINGFAAKSLKEPDDSIGKQTDIKNAWKVWGKWDTTVTSYKTDTNGNVIGEDGKRFMRSDRFGSSHLGGACGVDEGAGIAIIATDIFSNGHGAKFCARQIQSANGGGKSWIDFYDTKEYRCYTFCKDGWYGNYCDSSQPTPLDDSDYRDKFDNIMDKDSTLDKNDTYCNDETKIKTSSTPVFKKLINHDNNFSQVYVLGVLDVKQHGILVGSVDIHVHKEDRNNSWLTSAKGNGQTTMLCASGYEPNSDKNDCVRKTGLPPQDGGNNEYTACDDGLGIDPTNLLQCIACDGLHQGVQSDGVCKTCDNNEIFSKAENLCKRYKTYSKSDMRVHATSKMKCWVETNKRDYEHCVKDGR